MNISATKKSIIEGAKDLTQKQKEAKEKGIKFECKFIYPADTNINAFDVSVILNNAIENAFEGAEECENPYVFISAYRKKNAYMLEFYVLT